MSTSLVIRNARVLCLDAADREWPRADIVILGHRIAAIGPDAGLPHLAGATRVIDAEGLLAMPGLINAHFHSPGNLMKGSLDGLPLELFMLHEVPPLADGGDSERLVYVRTALGALEMLQRGITAVHDDAYHVPVASKASIDAIMQAYADVGIRATVAIDQPNVVEYEKYPFLAELLTPAHRAAMDAAPRQSSLALLSLYAHLIEKWHGKADGRLRAAVSCSAPQRVTVDYFEGLSALSRQHDLPFNIHILETKLQRVLGEDKYAKSLVRYVHDLGLLDARMMIIHAIWIDSEDIRLIAGAGASVAHNPVCNLRLGSGVMPWRQLRNAGVPLCIGTDEMNTDDTTNLWLAGKTAALLQNIAEPDYLDWPRAPEILHAMTAGGARAMRYGDELGQLRAGALADISLLDLDTHAFTPLNDLRRQLVFCEDGSSVRTTIVNGEVVCEGGIASKVNAKALRAEARALMADYSANLQHASSEAAQLAPAYREMFLRAAQRDVGFSRHVSPHPHPTGVRQ
ncbi:amidohydrolase family protein [Uliginosibacterium sp. TH139]|uniref:amidohydrolase family protein n=1 Tax=Uliginosibacterium sp. TH139 TaxID=2067453 RepID=UPI000C7BD481|nr:amidohydrolase family protein [Uliginosibacterium sp. TH139]PLK48101.1 5-methylthioadenosine deaminase [Uliginosibacterium sp. TH139]